MAEHRTLQRSSELNNILEQFRRAIAETNSSKDALTNFSGNRSNCFYSSTSGWAFSHLRATDVRVFVCKVWKISIKRHLLSALHLLLIVLSLKYPALLDVICDYYDSAVGKYLSLSSSRLLNVSTLQARFLKKPNPEIKKQTKNSCSSWAPLVLSRLVLFWQLNKNGEHIEFTIYHFTLVPLHSQAKPKKGSSWSGLASVSTSSDFRFMGMCWFPVIS